MPRSSTPLSVKLPDDGVVFAESVHAQDFRMQERVDPFHKLLYVLAGEVEFQAEPENVVARAGSVLAVPAGFAHALVDRTPSTLLLLCLGRTFVDGVPDLAALWNELARAPRHHLALGRPNRLRIEGLWRRALLETASRRTGGELALRCLAQEIVLYLARLPPVSETDTPAARVAIVRREIDESFHDEWSLDRAATRAGLSRRHFSSLFRAATGASFWTHLNETRLTHAASLLARREHSIVGVMFSCGFNDLSTFYRQFRRRFGVPPGSWAATGQPGAVEKRRPQRRSR